ncbi:MAG: SDR family NAD(P)-dependent oxidoreductase [Bifidobacteriaceae bacterium]|jgi:NAD(P)-dependent dehydrogenase (short-subunit alcohol dehydrogenase family)|nr:SDR family NAD(P)-dependent oxidoreductase [Bifidobacteriaceae bacterium]
MKDYQGKVVAITGAASGIGREMVGQLAAKGARFSLADIGDERLSQMREELEALGVEAVTSHVDVRVPEEMEHFAVKTIGEFGTVDYMFNNAGISAVGNAWKMPLSDWRWLIDVNLFGPVNACRAFIPRMIELDKECCFVITASAAGFVSAWGGAGYSASKHAVIGMAEGLESDLRKAGAQVKVHVIAPSYVQSNLHNSLQYRQAAEWDPADPAYSDADYKDAMDRSTKSTSEDGGVGIPVDEAVRRILTGLDEDRFVILTHPETASYIENRYHRFMVGKRPGQA